jgi:hypothetical protein
LSAVYSPDGTRWTPLELELVEPLAFSGRVLLLARGPRQHYRIRPAVTTRYLRFSLDRSDPVYWWSVEEIRVAAPSSPVPDDRSSGIPAAGGR